MEKTIKKLLWILLIAWALFALFGCGSTPYLDTKVVYQHNDWSDWVLQPERPWTGDDSEVRVHLSAGLSRDDIDCYVETIVVGPWDQMLLGCAKRFGGPRYFIQPALVHQVDGRTSQFLKTDQTQWQGHNPFFHIRAGMQWGKVRCPVIATGKSLFQGAPFEREEGQPDLYWVNVECGVRWSR